MLDPTAEPNEPELTAGRDPVKAGFALPLLSKYFGVLKFTCFTLTYLEILE